MIRDNFDDLGCTVCDEAERERVERERRLMTELPAEKVWKIPAYADNGPVTIALTIPEVRVTDSQGREIVLSPAQADRVSSKLGNVCDWLHYAESDCES